MAIFALAIVSCSKDDDSKPAPEENNVPEINAQSFTVPENITDSTVIGTVEATDDDDDDTLVFSLTAQSSAFEITPDGDLTLKSGESLDFATAQSHSFSVRVSDGTDSAIASITVNVTEVDPENQAPEVAAEFEFDPVPEDIAEDVVIGTVTATDPEGHPLTYTIADDPSGLFEISAQGGEISLIADKALDYETAEEHTFEVSVSDGEFTDETEVTFYVLNVIESLFEDPASLILSFETKTNSESVEIGLGGENPYDYDYTIDWGDGTDAENIDHKNNPIHEYTDPGKYSVAIKGTFPTIYMENGDEESS